MGFIFEDRVRDTTTTSGTGNITLSGVAPINYKTFNSVLTAGDQFPYAIVSRSLNEWEVGIGTSVSALVFSRSPLRSSNSNALVNFTAATTKDVVLSMISDKTTMRTWLGVGAGLSGLFAPSTQAAVVGNPANTTETTLLSYTLPANAVTTIGRGVKISADGYWGGAGTAFFQQAIIRLYFGSEVFVLNNPAPDTSRARWHAEMEAVLAFGSGGSAQWVVSGWADTQFDVLPYGNDPTINNAATILIKVTGQSPVAGLANMALVYHLSVSPRLADVASVI